MLAHAGREDGRLRVVERAQPLDHVLRARQAVLRGRVAERVRRAPVVDLQPPGLKVRPSVLALLLLECRHQVVQHVLQVAHDRHVHGTVLADLRRVDVGVNHGRVRREAVQLSRHAVVEAGTQGHHEVGLLQGGHRGNGAVHSGHAQVLRVAVGQGAARHQRGHDGRAGQVGQLTQPFRCPRANDAAAHVQHGPAGGGEQARRLLDGLGVWLGAGVEAGQFHAVGPGEDGTRLHRGLGDVDEHRSRAAVARDVEGLRDGGADVGRVFDQHVVLGDGRRNAHDVSLLEGIRADQRGPHLAGDGDHRDRVHVGIGDGRHEVGGARAGGDDARAHPAGGVGVALGRVAGTLLMPREDVAQDRGIHQRVIGREDRAARDAEDVGHPRELKRTDQGLCSRHRLAGTRDRARVRGPRCGGRLGPLGRLRLGLRLSHVTPMCLNVDETLLPSPRMKKPLGPVADLGEARGRCRGTGP